MSTPAMVEALEAVRHRNEVLEIEKANALKRFGEQTAELRRVRAENAELKAQLAKCKREHHG